MFYQSRLIFCTTIVMTYTIGVHTTGMHTLESRTALAKRVLSMENNLAYSTRLFTEDNDMLSAWFENHVQGLQNFLRNEINRDIEIALMGSYRWKTNHILSNATAAIVTNGLDYDSIMQSLKYYYEHNFIGTEVVISKTMAGLMLLTLHKFIDAQLGEIKLQYTIQTPAVNRLIIDETEKRMLEKFSNDDEKVLYALEVMKTVLENNTEKQLALTQWTRILPITK